MKIILNGLKPHPKERPRSSGDVHYMSETYRLWQAQFFQLWHRTVPTISPFTERVAIKILWLTPTGNCRCDLDNAEAAVWDALVKVGILQNDTSKCIGEGAHRIEVGPLATGILITPYVISKAAWLSE